METQDPMMPCGSGTRGPTTAQPHAYLSLRPALVIMSLLPLSGGLTLNPPESARMGRGLR